MNNILNLLKNCTAWVLMANDMGAGGPPRKRKSFKAPNVSENSNNL
jgi:hypothetical protein